MTPTTITTRWGTFTNPTRDRLDAGRRVEVYLGTGHPNLLPGSPVPLFLSATSLTRYRGRDEHWNIRDYGAGWAFDSGAYTALTGTNPDHPWHYDLDDFGSLVTRLIEDIGEPVFAAIPDYPCEPDALARTGMTPRQHGEYTVDTYQYLTAEFPHIPWLPVIQGWTPDQYEACERLYLDRGVDLAGARRVGLGSICRRGSDTDIAGLVERFAARGYRLHGFGVSIKGLRRIGHLLTSTDSQAWSDTARKEQYTMPGCEHWSRPDKTTGERRLTDCRNCFRWALHYREQMIDAIRDSATRPAAAPPRYEQLALAI